MVKIFSIDNRVFLNQIQPSEIQLNKFLSKNWEHLFPQYIFIKSEFPLSGNVRTSGSSGRIDILAFNPNSNKLVVFELKRDFSRNIRDQAGDYRDKIVSSFHEIYLLCTQEYDVELPRYKTIVQDSIETILISNSFSTTDIEKVNNFKNDGITLIKYSWFENDLFLIEYLNNAPTEKLQNIQQTIPNIIASQKKITSLNAQPEISQHSKQKSKEKILKVTINGKVIQETKVKNTLIKVIEHLGLDRVKNKVDIGGKFPIVIDKNELKNYEPHKYSKSISNDYYYIMTHSSTDTKRGQLSSIAQQLDEEIKIEDIPYSS